MTLCWSELDKQPWPTFSVLAGGCGDLDRAIGHDDPRALVHLMVGQALAGREVEHNRARGIARGQDLR